MLAKLALVCVQRFGLLRRSQQLAASTSEAVFGGLPGIRPENLPSLQLVLFVMKFQVNGLSTK